MGDCQNYGPFLGPYYNTGPNTGPNLGDPKWDHNFDNPPYSPIEPLNTVDSDEDPGICRKRGEWRSHVRRVRGIVVKTCHREGATASGRNSQESSNRPCK